MPSTDDRILVFIPAYNCAPQIGRVLAQFDAVPAGRFAEILVLDNGSKDGTQQAALAAAQSVRACPVTVARNRANYNLGGSHKSAFAYAAAQGCTHVVVLHGDDQGHIGDLLPVLDRGDHRGNDACLGARFMRGSRLQGYSKFRIFGNHVFNGLFTVAARRRITDLGSGLNIFSRSIFADPGISRYADDLRFNVYLLLGMTDRGLRFTFATDALIPLRQGFRVAGLGSVNEWLVPTNYHAPTDTPENVDFRSVHDTVDVVLGVIERLRAR